ncbi:phage tail protein [Achromobacter sp. AGC39]
MSKPVFPWAADLGATVKRTPSVNTTKYGDGYEARVATGINSAPRTWSVTFTYPWAVAGKISDFLLARGGVEAFTWTDGRGNTANYKCAEWSEAQAKKGLHVISADFVEVFEA